MAKSSRSTVAVDVTGGTFRVASIEQRVKDIIVEQLGVEEDEVSPRHRLSMIWGPIPWIRSNS